MVDEADFYLEAHRHEFRAMKALQAQDAPIDLVTLISELKHQGHLDACGGPATIAGLTDGLPRATNVPHYASMVKEAAVRRKIITLSESAASQAYLDDEPTKEIIERVQLELLRLAGAGRKGGWIKAKDLVGLAYDEIDAIAHRKTETAGLDTGFKQLNRLTLGFKRGELIILAGRPGHGKSAIITNIITNGIIRHGWRVGLFTIEMSAVEIMKRALFGEAEIDSYQAGGGYLNKSDWARLGAAAAQIAETRLSVDESGGVNLAELRSKAQSLAVDGGVDLIAIDYLQLMSGSGRRGENRVTELAEITRGLKVLAKDLNVPVIALSQLSRAVEGDKGRKPILADLRESGSIEQDADMVLFIWREELRSGKEEDKGRAELIIGKQRNGPTGTIELTFIPRFTKFVDYAAQSALPEGR